MKKNIIALSLLLASCSYDDSFDVLKVSVSLEYPENSPMPHAGARVEMTDSHASVFVDSTDAEGVAHFIVPPGIYEVASSGTLLTYDYRYIYNGIKGQVVITADSINRINLPITVTKKRIVH